MADYLDDVVVLNNFHSYAWTCDLPLQNFDLEPWLDQRLCVLHRQISLMVMKMDCWCCIPTWQIGDLELCHRVEPVAVGEDAAAPDGPFCAVDSNVGQFELPAEDAQLGHQPRMIDGNWQYHSPNHCSPPRVWTHLTPETKHHQSTEISDLTLAIRTETRCLFTKLANQRDLNHYEVAFQVLNWVINSLTLIGMSYESKKNAHILSHLGAFFIRLNELGRVSN